MASEICHILCTPGLGPRAIEQSHHTGGMVSPRSCGPLPLCSNDIDRQRLSLSLGQYFRPHGDLELAQSSDSQSTQRFWGFSCEVIRLDILSKPKPFHLERCGLLSTQPYRRPKSPDKDFSDIQRASQFRIGVGAQRVS